MCSSLGSVLDAGPLSKVLGQMKTFMDANPNEVLTIFWENAENLTPAQYQVHILFRLGQANNSMSKSANQSNQRQGKTRDSC